MSDTNGGRTHEPSLREHVAELDGFRDLVNSQLKAIDDRAEERDRRYEDRFSGQQREVAAALASAQRAVDAALASAEKLTSASFAASEKAIVKAETAQSDYNVRSNEFRGQLDDQAKTLMPRTEANVRFDAFDKEIQSLRDSRNVGMGRDQQQSTNTDNTKWIIGIAIAIAGLFVSMGLVVAFR